MEEDTDSSVSGSTVPDSPKPLAFTIDFGEHKSVDIQRQKALAEKFQKRHKRGQSLSKIEDSPATTTPPTKQHPLTGNLPRKSSFQSEGYFSSDEKNERLKSGNVRASAKRSDLTLLLKNVTSDRMTQSFPSVNLPCVTSPDVQLKDLSSPEFDLVSPFSPLEQSEKEVSSILQKQQYVSSECEKLYIGDDREVFVEGTEFEFEKSDDASDTGTYTLENDKYSEEQKARMSIDRDFKIEQVSIQKKTEDYIKSLSSVREHVMQTNATSNISAISKSNLKKVEILRGSHVANITENDTELKSPKSPTRRKFEKLSQMQLKKVLSPIMSPTQNMSITQDIEEKAEIQINNSDADLHNQTFTKIIFPSANAKRDGLEKCEDHGSVVSVTSSGAFKPKPEQRHERKYSLSKSEVQVQAYIDGRSCNDVLTEPLLDRGLRKKSPKLTATIVNVQNIEVKKLIDTDNIITSSTVGKLSIDYPKCTSPVTSLPPAVGGKTSPSKIPSPIHTLSRPRSRSSLSSLNVELSDNSIDTDLILKPTQNYINSLQQRLSLDSDPDSDYDIRYGLQLNNTAHLLKQKASHTRHNSLDDRTLNVSNKLEHFQSKNFQGIDQTFTNVFNQYSQNKVMHKIHNSPNNSPIKRSSSFSTRNQIHSPKNTNIVTPQKELGFYNSTRLTERLTKSASIQRSSSTASIKPNYLSNRRASISDHQKIDRSQFADTESSSEEDYDRNLQKRKDLANITNTRCNRAFSLRRARADNETTQLKCPNTPEMRRKTFQPEMKQERAISVDRKPMKTNDVQSRYLMNISKRSTPPPSVKVDAKTVPKVNSATKATANRPTTFSRTDSGRFSMRTSKPPVTNNVPKVSKKEGSAGK